MSSQDTISFHDITAIVKNAFEKHEEYLRFKQNTDKLQQVLECIHILVTNKQCIFKEQKQYSINILTEYLQEI